MQKMIYINITILLATLLFSCNSESEGLNADDSENLEVSEKPKRSFITSFENVNDFDGFFITPQGHLGTTFHELTESNVYSGTYSHRAWIDGDNLQSAAADKNHRGYPTVQFRNTDEGPLKTPCYISLRVWLDIELNSNVAGEDDWFSFATFTDDESDNWARTVLVNLSSDGLVHLQHTTNQGEQNHIFQTTDIRFPQKQWVELTIYLNFTSNGYVKVWQDGELVSYAEIGNITNKLSQAHFGLYTPPQLSSGEVFNDDLLIKEVNEE